MAFEIKKIGNISMVAFSDLEDFYKKSETYSKEEINELVSVIQKVSIEVVSNLPTENISNTTIYLVASSEESQNLYDEYIYINSSWELLGSQRIDLSGYAKTDEIIQYVEDNIPSLEGLATEEYVNTISESKLSIDGGIMTGALKASADVTPTVSKVRNSSLVSFTDYDETLHIPAQNGDICWIYR